jgi:hypothetical protein
MYWPGPCASGVQNLPVRIRKNGKGKGVREVDQEKKQRIVRNKEDKNDYPIVFSSIIFGRMSPHKTNFFIIA